MARVLVTDKHISVKLNLIEKMLAFRRNVRVPTADVISVSIVERPWDSVIPDRVTMGFAASTAPGRTTATIGPRAKSGSGRALVVVYRNRQSVVIELDPSKTPWSLLVVSTHDARHISEQLRATTGPPGERP